MNEKKKVILITGGNKGIGSAIAKKFASKNIVLVNYYNDDEKAKFIKNTIQNKKGQCELLKYNIGDPRDIKKMFNYINKKYQSLNTLINCAGVSPTRKPIEKTPTKEIQNVFYVNALGTIYCCKEALSHFRHTSLKIIINITSEAAKFGGRNISHYAASKAAIETFSKGISREIGDSGVRINCISPGIISSDAMNDPKVTHSIPLKRVGRPEEVAELAYWLASNKASYINGQSIGITGGR